MEGREGSRERTGSVSERGSGVVSLDIHQILSILPHRFPFVMVDRVIEVLPGKSIRGHKGVTYNEPWFPGHFPQRPIMPGVLILESLAQIGGILAYASEPFDPTSNLMFFLGIDKAKFRHTVVPGDRLDLYVEVVHHRSNVWKLRGEASVDGTLCAEGELLASIVDRQP
jgi:3-hydroxyacyl-[acyl-carrier-protein] dehydratase